MNRYRFRVSVTAPRLRRSLLTELEFVGANPAVAVVKAHAHVRSCDLEVGCIELLSTESVQTTTGRW